MANHLTRRSFLASVPPALAVGTVVAAPLVVEAATTVEMTAIPTDVYDKIKAWQCSHREACKAMRDYSAALRVKPINKAECDRAWKRYLEFHEKTPPSREAMIVALLEI